MREGGSLPILPQAQGCANNDKIVLEMYHYERTHENCFWWVSNNGQIFVTSKIDEDGIGIVL